MSNCSETHLLASAVNGAVLDKPRHYPPCSSSSVVEVAIRLPSQREPKSTKREGISKKTSVASNHLAQPQITKRKKTTSRSTPHHRKLSRMNRSHQGLCLPDSPERASPSMHFGTSLPAVESQNGGNKKGGLEQAAQALSTGRIAYWNDLMDVFDDAERWKHCLDSQNNQEEMGVIVGSTQSLTAGTGVFVDVLPSTMCRSPELMCRTTEERNACEDKSSSFHCGHPNLSNPFHLFSTENSLSSENLTETARGVSKDHLTTLAEWSGLDEKQEHCCCFSEEWQLFANEDLETEHHLVSLHEPEHALTQGWQLFSDEDLESELDIIHHPEPTTIPKTSQTDKLTKH